MQLLRRDHSGQVVGNYPQVASRRQQQPPTGWFPSWILTQQPPTRDSFVMSSYHHSIMCGQFCALVSFQTCLQGFGRRSAGKEHERSVCSRESVTYKASLFCFVLRKCHKSSHIPIMSNSFLELGVPKVVEGDENGTKRTLICQHVVWQVFSLGTTPWLFSIGSRIVSSLNRQRLE